MVTNKRHLTTLLNQFKTSGNWLISRENDSVLEILLNDVRKRPSKITIARFANTLNSYYNAGLRYERGSMLKVVEIINQQWKKGLKLGEIYEGQDVNTNKVDKLRSIFYNNLTKDYYSYVTKIFHQLNSQYPIYDRLMIGFLKKEKTLIKNNIKNYEYAMFLESVTATMHKYKWNPEDVNGFDNAIWVYMNGERITSAGKSK
jgi:hypothetical protein